VKCEDYQHNLEKAMRGIYPVDGDNAVELGAGTGRVTTLLAGRFRNIYAFDLSMHMLETARMNLQPYRGLGRNLAVCDHLALPVKAGLADLVISGWSVCYALIGDEEEWRSALDQVLSEMSRILKPGGKRLIIETLGTGYETPSPPSQLAPYYQVLEKKGFQHTWIRTDYLFKDMADASSLAGFFFGTDILQYIIYGENGLILPECTGIWWDEKSELAGD
jgi:ubiquinone/menaquinone biosynthesis C-methylase UbiE